MIRYDVLSEFFKGLHEGSRVIGASSIRIRHFKADVMVPHSIDCLRIRLEMSRNNSVYEVTFTDELLAEYPEYIARVAYMQGHTLARKIQKEVYGL